MAVEYGSGSINNAVNRVMQDVQDGQMIACACPVVTLGFLLTDDVADTGLQENKQISDAQCKEVCDRLDNKLRIVNDKLHNLAAQLKEHDIDIVRRTIAIPDALVIGSRAHGRIVWTHEDDNESTTV